MVNPRWILSFAMMVTTIEQTLCQPAPGQCKIAFSNFLNCNNVTQDQVNGMLSNDNLITQINVANSDIGTFDANYFIDGTAEKTKALAISDDMITEITADAFQDFKILKTLQINRNPLTSLPTTLFDNLNQLSSLYVEQNEIKTLKRNTFSNLPDVTLIYLDGNPVETIENGTFYNLTSSVDLELSHTQLTEFPTYGFDEVKISSLSLTNTSISYLHSDAFVTLPYLTDLNMAYNKIDFMADGVFSNVPRLNSLNLAWNFLTEFSPKRLELPNFLMYLYLNNSQLSSLDFKEFIEVIPGLRQLTLDYNPWSCDALPTMLQDAQNFAAYISWGPWNTTGPSVDGIPCVQ